MSVEDRLAAVEQSLASAEGLFEQLQENAQLGRNLNEYVDTLKSEQAFFNKARKWIGGLSIVVIIFLLALLAIAIFHAKSPLLGSPPAAIAAFIVSIISGAALLIHSFIKGVFRTAVNRHSDGFLPPALEKAADILNKINGKS